MGNTTCPRRVTEDGDWKKDFNLDDWHADGTCSFCGSLQPQIALEWIQQGKTVTPCDVNYKMVIEGVPVFFQHFTVDEWRLLTSLLNANRIRFAFPGHFIVMPYKIKVKQGNTMKQDDKKSTPKPPHVMNNPKVTDKRNTRPDERKVIKKRV